MRRTAAVLALMLAAPPARGGVVTFDAMTDPSRPTRACHARASQ
jgi:hypothetical protein